MYNNVNVQILFHPLAATFFRNRFRPATRTVYGRRTRVNTRTLARTHIICTDRLTTNGDGHGCRPGGDGRRPALPPPPMVVVVLPPPPPHCRSKRIRRGV